MAMKSLKEKWLSIVQLAEEKGEKGIGGSSTVTLGEVDVSTPIPLIFSFTLHLLFVSLTFPWT